MYIRELQNGTKILLGGSTSLMLELFSLVMFFCSKWAKISLKLTLKSHFRKNECSYDNKTLGYNAEDIYDVLWHVVLLVG